MEAALVWGRWPKLVKLLILSRWTLQGCVCLLPTVSSTPAPGGFYDILPRGDLWVPTAERWYHAGSFFFNLALLITLAHNSGVSEASGGGGQHQQL